MQLPKVPADTRPQFCLFELSSFVKIVKMLSSFVCLSFDTVLIVSISYLSS